MTNPSEYTIGWICALQRENVATQLDVEDVSKIKPPLFCVPYTRNRNYVERKEVHQMLDHILAQKGGQPRVALWALGGMGKTAVAVEYCYQKFALGASVYWVNGQTNESIQASYREIHKAANLPDSDADIATLQATVKAFLDSPESAEWFMVVDNVEDLSLEFEHIPTRRGAVLFTTRNRGILSSPSFGSPEGVAICKMTKEEASATCKKLGMRQDPTEINAQKELLQKMDHLPLAIAQAAAFMHLTGSTTQEYLAIFTNTEDRAKLLDHSIEDLSPSNNDKGVSRTVMTTWSVTTERIKKDNPLAIEILELMSVLDKENIPIAIIYGAAQYKGISQLRLRQSLGQLYCFAFITKLRAKEESYRLHPLVSFWTLQRLQPERKNGVLELGCQSIVGCFPDDIEGSLPSCSTLMPHATTLHRHFNENGLNTDDIWLLREKVMKCHKYKRAIEMGNMILEHKERTLGKYNSSTLRTVGKMALVFYNQGKYHKALKWYQRALEGRERYLGKDHPDTLTTVNNMALVFDNQGEYDKGLEWYRRALEGRERS